MKKIIIIAMTSIALTLSGATFASGIHSGKRFDRIDRNDNGQLSKREVHRAAHIKNRVDANDDGKIGKRERHFAQTVRANADRNGDGEVGRGERHAVKHVLNRVDRNH